MKSGSHQPHIVVIRDVTRDGDHRRRRVAEEQPQLPGELEPIQSWKAKIGKQDIRTELSAGVKRLTPVVCRACRKACFCKQKDVELPAREVIFDNEHLRRG